MAEKEVTKGNERTFMFANVTELAGEEEHEKLKELELIFGPYEDVDAHALRQCRNLHKLTVINCRLQRIPTTALHAVRASLVHLCLASQQITRIESLDLPNLRYLYLQHNRIERIEGLDTCRRLRVLWLTGNCVRQIENLGQCGDLRELWLQDNAISSITGTGSDSAVQDLVNLESLCLAKNRVRGIDELEALRKMVNLRMLSFVDEHYGTNPIVRHPEYRALAIATARQLQSLDGVPVDDSERKVAVDHFMIEAIEFSDTIAALELEYEQQVHEIQTRCQRNESNAVMLQRELVEALNQVEHTVVSGLKELEQHKQQQVRVREQHVAMTVAELDRLKETYRQQLDDQLQFELKALEEAELYYEVTEQEALAEQQIVLTLTTLQCTHPDKIAFEQLAEHSPDHAYISSHFIKWGEDSGWISGDGDFNLLYIYRFFHQDLAGDNGYDRDSNQDRDSASTSRPGEGFVSYLYCAVSEDEAMSILQGGFKDGCANSQQWLVLFSNPYQALGFDEGDIPSDPEENRNRSSNAPRVKSHLLLLCRVTMHHVSDVTLGEARLRRDSSLSLSSIVSLTTAAASPDLAKGEFIHMSLETANQSGDIYITTRSQSFASIVPEFVLLCSERPVPISSSSVNIMQSSDQASPEQLLTEYSRDVDKLIRQHHGRLWQGIDPTAWTQSLKLREELIETNRELAAAKKAINQEKKVQRQVIKSARARK